jgi:hypothetical protein
MSKDVYITYYTKEYGKIELTWEERLEYRLSSITLHREDGPARVSFNGEKEWFINGKRHRLDGPAVKWVAGDEQWWIDSKEYSEKDFNKTIEEAKALPLELRLTDPRWWVREIK